MSTKNETIQNIETLNVNLKKISQLDEVTNINDINDNDLFIITHVDNNISDDINISKKINFNTLSRKILSLITTDDNVNIEISSIDVANVIGLGKLATRDTIINSDIDGSIPANKIENLGNLATKNKISSSDVSGKLSLSSIEEISTNNIISLNGYNNSQLLSTELAETDSLNTALQKIQGQINNTREQLHSCVTGLTITSEYGNTNGIHIATINYTNKDGSNIRNELYTPISSNNIIGIANTGVGTIIPYAGKTENIPSNTLVCDGRQVSKSSYSSLYKVIGDTYGTPTDTEHFVLPNLTNKFIEGTNDTNDTGEELSAGIPNISGMLGTIMCNNTDDVTGPFDKHEHGRYYTRYGNIDSYKRISFNANKVSKVYGNSNTVQPPAIKMRYLIVHKEIALDTFISEFSKNNICITSTHNFNSGIDNDQNNSWCRIYSDNWCEQGGCLQLTDSAESQYTINLYKQFSNITYNITFGIQCNNNIKCIITNKQQNSFTINIGTLTKSDTETESESDTTPYYISWEAKGFISNV